MTTPEALLTSARDRLAAAFPLAKQITVDVPDRGRLRIGVSLETTHHLLWMSRQDGLWVLEEHRANGIPQLMVYTGERRFEKLVEAAIGPSSTRPRVRVRELRCPEDSRRMFGKIIVLAIHDPSNLLEFSCPQCKRRTGEVTMHYFDMTGECVKTQATEPWVKRESTTPWFSARSDDDDHEGAFLPSTVGRYMDEPKAVGA